MGTMIRVIGMGLFVFGVLLVLIGLSDDAPGAILLAMLLFGVAGYALLAARREDAHRARTDALLERIAAALDRGDPRT